jgi:hypothetical protein
MDHLDLKRNSSSPEWIYTLDYAFAVPQRGADNIAPLLKEISGNDNLWVRSLRRENAPGLSRTATIQTKI